MDTSLIKIIILVVILLVLFIEIFMLYLTCIKNKMSGADDRLDDTTTDSDLVNDVLHFINNYRIKELDSECFGKTWAVPRKIINYQEEHEEQTGISGWKIHISPKLSTIKTVLQLVCDYCLGNNSENELIMFKFRYDIKGYNRHSQVDEDKNDYVRGKFIAIYPISDEQAKRIADDLHKLFIDNNITENDFIIIKNDFLIYPGIYTRLTNYKDNNGSSREFIGILVYDLIEHLKRIKVINEKVNNDRIKISDIRITKDDINNVIITDNDIKSYNHPFEKLYFKNKLLPKNVNILCDLLGIKSVFDLSKKINENLNEPKLKYVFKIINWAKEKYVSDLENRIDELKTKNNITNLSNKDILNIFYAEQIKIYKVTSENVNLNIKIDKNNNSIDVTGEINDIRINLSNYYNEQSGQYYISNIKINGIYVGNIYFNYIDFSIFNISYENDFNINLKINQNNKTISGEFNHINILCRYEEVVNDNLNGLSVELCKEIGELIQDCEIYKNINCNIFEISSLSQFDAEKEKFNAIFEFMKKQPFNKTIASEFISNISITNSDEIEFYNDLAKYPPALKLSARLINISRKYNNPNIHIGNIQNSFNDMSNYVKGLQYVNEKVEKICSNMIDNITNSNFELKFNYETETDANKKKDMINNLYEYSSIDDYNKVLLYSDLEEYDIEGDKYIFLEPLLVQLYSNELDKDLTKTITNAKAIIKPKFSLFA